MDQSRLEQALSISPRLYDAALDPTKWPAVLGDLRHALNAQVAQLNLADLGTATILASFDHGMTDEQRHHYLSYSDFRHGDPRTKLIQQSLFKPFHCRQYLTEEEWHGSPIYRAVHSRWGMDYTLGYAVPLDDSGLIAVLGFTRHRDTGVFTQDDLDHISLYVPHLRRAFEVMMTLAAARDVTATFVTAFDRLEQAVLIVDRFGRLRHANAAARALLADQRGLMEHDGLIQAHDAGTVAALRSAILDAGVAAMTGVPLEPRGLNLPDAPHGPALWATVSPLATDAQSTTGLMTDGGLVGLFVTDPARRYETDPERLQRLFGLTGTEAAIAAGLAEHGSARTLAEATGRNYETVRGHIKVIREKTGASSQGTLVRLVTQALA